MIALESVVLKPSLPWSRRIRNDDVRLTAVPNDRGLPFDIAIQAFGENRNYQRFAQCVIGERLGSFGGNIQVALQSDRKAFLAVVGLYRVLFLDNLTKSIHEHCRPGIEKRDSGFDLCLSGWDARQGV